MKNILFPAALMLMGTLTATAQSAMVADNSTTTTTVAATEPGTDDCVARTTPEAWTSLGLSAEQMSKVSAIQGDHKKACAAMADKKATSEMTDKHTAQIKEVLTTDQYTKWMDWCQQRAQGTSKPESK